MGAVAKCTGLAIVPPGSVVMSGPEARAMSAEFVTRAAGEPDVNPKTKTRATAAARGYTLLTQQKDLTAPRCVGRHAFP